MRKLIHQWQEAWRNFLQEFNPIEEKLEEEISWEKFQELVHEFTHVVDWQVEENCLKIKVREEDWEGDDVELHLEMALTQPLHELYNDIVQTITDAL